MPPPPRSSPRTRAERWADRARDQLAALRARLEPALGRHLARHHDPRVPADVLRALGARRILPLGHGLRQAPVTTGCDVATRAFLALCRADRAALWPLRGARRVEPAVDPREQAARRAALRRWAEGAGALRRASLTAAPRHGPAPRGASGVGGVE